MSRNVKVKKIFVLFLIILSFIIITSYKLDLRVVTDESWVSAPAYNLAISGKSAIPAFKGDPAGNDKIFLGLSPQILIMSTTFKILGLNVMSGRYISIFWGAITILLSFLLAERLFNTKIALFSSMLVATDNFIFLAARTIRSEIYIAAFLALAFYLFLKANNKGSLLLFFSSGFLVGLSIIEHPNAIFIFVAFITIFLFEQGLASLLRKDFWIFISGTASIIIPFIIYIIFMVLPDKFQFFMGQYMFEDRILPLFSLDWLFFSLKGEVFRRWADFIYFPFRIHMILIYIFSITYSFISYKNRANRNLLIIILTWIVLLWLLTVSKMVRYITPIIPFFSILFAASFLDLQQKVKKNLKMVIKILIVVIIVVQIGGNFIFLYKFKDSGYYEFINNLEEIIPKNATIYGPITYWIGLNDYNYLAYDKVPFVDAVGKFNADIYILGCRELEVDDPYFAYTESCQALKNEMNKYFKIDNQGILLGKVDNPFYGNIEIYTTNKRYISN